jgi:hypothetical protein
MHNMLDLFIHDKDDILPKQIRSVVKEVVGEVQGKHIADPINTPALHTIAAQGDPRVAFDVSRMDQVATFNLPQSFYQTMAYGPTFPPGGNNGQYGAAPDMRLPQAAVAPYVLDTNRVASGEMLDNMRDQVTRMLRKLRFTPKGCARSYQKPYPVYFNSVPCPRGFRIPDFTKFTGDNPRTTYEHVGQ